MKAIFFDGDDTLWSIDRLYRNKQEEVARYVSSKYNVSFDDALASVISGCQNYMVKDQKFSRSLFPSTCCKAISNIVPSLLNEDVLAIYTIADTVFDFEPKLYEDTITTLIELGRLGYKSFILTQGDYMVQSSKIFRLKLYDYVSDTIIVDVKTQDVYETLKEKYPTIERYIMVGDSYDRDIKPSRQAGWETLMIERSFPMMSTFAYATRRISKLSEVLRYIKETDHDLEP